MNAITIRAWNFRGMDHLEWSPEGVCLLVGPNGAGKSTTLAALRFMRTALLRGVAEAVRFAGGATGLRCLRAAQDADVVFELEWRGTTWRLELPVDGDGIHSYHGERLTHDGAVLLNVPRLQADYQLGEQKRGRDARAELNTLVTIDPQAWLKAFCDVVRSIRIYDDFNLNRASKPVAEDDDDLYLHPAGSNLVPVLRNWKAAPRQFKGQFDWVVRSLREAFPDLIEDLEFPPSGTAAFYPANAPHPDAKLPLGLAASGLITGLLQLTAVAGAKPASVIAFDEMENQLHPHAIRMIIHAMREMAKERDLTIVLTTHSPVVLNAFREEPEQVYVLNHGQPGIPNPGRMSELHTEEWLAHGKLGTLYERLAFGAPPIPGLPK